MNAAIRPKPADSEKPTRKRKLQTAEPEDNEDEPEEPQATRRPTTIDLEIEDAMGEGYVANMLDNEEPTVASNALHSERSMSMSPATMGPQRAMSGVGSRSYSTTR